MAKINVGKKELIWVYFSRFLTIGINILLLPLIMKYLRDDELGLWYVFASISQVVNLFDFGFNATISRHMTYAWSGAGRLEKSFTSKEYSNTTNTNLVSQIIVTCRLVYLIISLVGLVLMSTLGTAYISKVLEGGFTRNIFFSWIVYIASMFLNMFYGYWSSLLQGIGAIAERSKMTVYSKVSQIIVAAILILSGLGLLGFVISYLISGMVLRIAGRIYFDNYTKTLDLNKKVSFDKVKECYSAVWATAWKDGMAMLAQYFSTQANTLICAYFIDLASTSVYGVMTQVVSLIATVSATYFAAYQPEFSSACLHNDKVTQKRIVCVTDFIYKVIYAVGVIALFSIGIPLIEILRPGIQIPVFFSIILCLFYYFFQQKDLFGSMISSFNEIPLWPSYVISAVMSVVLSIVFVRYMNMGIVGIVTAQLAVNLAYNCWHWPIYLMKKVEVNYADIYEIGFNFTHNKIKHIFNQRKEGNDS